MVLTAVGQVRLAAVPPPAAGEILVANHDLTTPESCASYKRSARDSLQAMQTIYPVLIYRDCPAAIDFLERAFGFERHAIFESENGAVTHGELRLGDEVVMVSSA